MSKLSEPEDLAMLRHRFARTIEMWVAYQTFLNKEVMVGEGKICLNDVVAAQTTHTLLIAYYSFVYSLFDPSAVHIKKITDDILESLPEDARESRDLALDEWEKIKKPVSIIRNNIGFHHSPKNKGASRGYQSYGSIHPFSTELIMHALRVFFRRVNDIYESSEPYNLHPKEEDTVALLERTRNLKKYIDENPHEELFEQIGISKNS